MKTRCASSFALRTRGPTPFDHGNHAFHRVQPSYRASFLYRVVRDAMVSVMLATTPQFTAVPSPPPPPTEAVEEGRDELDSNCQVEGRWSKAIPATDVALPRTTSTCLMWCAIALGALVRGCPSANVGRHATKTELMNLRDQQYLQRGLECARSRDSAHLVLGSVVS